jgi:hypothetical protein
MGCSRGRSFCKEPSMNRGAPSSEERRATSGSVFAVLLASAGGRATVRSPGMLLWVLRPSQQRAPPRRGEHRASTERSDAPTAQRKALRDRTGPLRRDRVIQATADSCMQECVPALQRDCPPDLSAPRLVGLHRADDLPNESCRIMSSLSSQKHGKDTRNQKSITKYSINEKMDLTSAT